MFKRIFLKYFTICASIILAVLILMGVLSSAVLAGQTINNTSTKLESAAGKLSRLYADLPKNGYLVGGRVLENAMDVVKDTLESDIIIVTDSGLLAASTLETVTTDVDELLYPEDALDTVLNGKTYRKNGIFIKQKPPRTAFTVGAPIMVGDNQIAGAVFVTTTKLGLWRELLPFFMIYLLFTGMALLIAFIIVYFVTLRMFNPLNQMSQAAKKYAQGDFSMRIAVKHDDELGELGMAFNHMADSLDRLESMRRGFVEDVSHELRTPMTTIAGFIDGILDGVIDEKDHKHYLGIVSEEIKRLSRMVSSMLDVARIQAGTMSYNKTTFDLATLLHRAMESFAERLGEKQARFVVDIDPDGDYYVYADQDSVYRVMYNLLDNAAKFVRPEGEVRLRMERRDGKVYASVYNTGEGISPKEASHIFDRFYKVDKSRSLNRSGVGIGLYLVRTVLRDQGGDIHVESKVGEYANFIFHLPAAEEI
ncbi:MAG: HAMP domain-containing histidine kinase [Clostridia bacterium]|nr:HAMP domain-containing histidine kinase [Clostridia bacterium]